MRLIDAHAHICAPEFDSDLDQVLQRAADSGVAGVVAVSETLEDAHKTLALAEQHPLVRPAAGLYPTHLDLDACAAVESFIRQQRDTLIAVGEVGLDYWVVKEAPEREVQREIFGRMVALAKELDLPLNVHSRAAGRHVVEFLRQRDASRVLLHAFDGKWGAAMPAVEAGYCFSVPPSIVHSRQKQKLCKQLPIDRILLETDSPVLGPDPEQRNEPANVRTALEAVAEIRGMAPEALAEQVLENTRQLFGDRVG